MYSPLRVHHSNYAHLRSSMQYSYRILSFRVHRIWIVFLYGMDLQHLIIITHIIVFCIRFLCRCTSASVLSAALSVFFSAANVYAVLPITITIIPAKSFSTFYFSFPTTSCVHFRPTSHFILQNILYFVFRTVASCYYAHQNRGLHHLKTVFPKFRQQFTFSLINFIN